MVFGMWKSKARRKAVAGAVVVVSLVAGVGLLLQPLIRRGRIVRLCEAIASGNVIRGAEVFTRHCLQCHPGLGPDLHSVAARAHNNSEGMEYLLQSIVDPGAVIVPMRGTRIQFYMPYIELTDQQVVDVAVYVLRLASQSIPSCPQTSPR